ncbi:MAG: hypothetical protein GY871_18080 [Actinomycetales bacterium]|nr:hypothetical protein [Actinomycetales bacterium]
MGRTVVALVAVLTAIVGLLPAIAWADETPRFTRQQETGECPGANFVVDPTWYLHVPDAASGAPSAGIADLMGNGEFLLGCEDEFPPVSIVGALTGACFLNPGCANDWATDGSDTLTLATYDELTPTAKSTINALYGVPSDWFSSLDDDSDAEAYAIAYLEADPQLGLGDKVLIVGASPDGLAHGVIDWFKSVERVRFDHPSGYREWSPAPASALDDQCNNYHLHGCLSNAACWKSGISQWEDVEEIEWCPERVLNYPDVPVRMGFPGWGAGGASFLPRILSTANQVNGAGRCNSSRTEADWWHLNVELCHRNPTGLPAWREAACRESLRRLDGLVWGKYTHAVDESSALWQSDGLAAKTSCDPALLYDEAWSYLRDRRVLLVPTAFGLEARSPDEPVGGGWESDGTDWAASQWGQFGNFTHSEGLAIIDRRFEACDDGGGTYFLSPTPSPGSWDDDGGVEACPDYFDPGSGAAVAAGVLPAGARPVDFDATDFLGATPASSNLIAVSDPSGCWLEVSGGVYMNRGEVDPTMATPCRMEISFPPSTQTENRLYAVTFQALAQPDGVRGVIKVTSVTGETERSDITIRETLNGTSGGSGYHEVTEDTADPDHDWVNFSLVVRVPPEDVDGDGSADVDEFVLELIGEHDGTDSLVWLDDIQIIELDGMLRNVDSDSFLFTNVLGEELDPTCFSVTADVLSGGDLPPHWEEDASAALTDLGWHSLLAPDGSLTDFRGSIEVVQPNGCTNLDGGSAWFATFDKVLVSYRTWTHAGLWPKVASTQDHYVYSPNVFDVEFWDDWLSPTSQMEALTSALGRSTTASDSDLRDQFILVSDVGGEVRGINRASVVEGFVTNAEKLASYYAQLRIGVYEAWNAGPWGPANCASMFYHPSNPAFAPCDGSGWTSLPGPTMLVAADMFTLAHNGSREFYQIPYAGSAGATGTTGDPATTTGALDYMPVDTTFLAWYHHDSKRAGTDVIGQEMAAGMVWDLREHGFDAIGGPARDADNQRQWAAMATSGAKDPGPNVKGVLYYGWGTDREGRDYMAQTGHYSWQSEWQMSDTWFLSNSVDNPGGNDLARYSTSGLSIVDDGVVRPLVGQAMRVNSNYSATWTSGDVLLDMSELGAEFTPLGPPSYDFDVTWTGNPQVLLRFYGTRPTADCVVGVEFEFDSTFMDGTEVSTAVVSPDQSTVGVWSDVRVYAARAPIPDAQTTTDSAFGLSVTATVTWDDCRLATFDNPALYQGTPFIDFPFAYIEHSIDAEWTSTDGNDARMMTCGSDTSTCIHPRTFDAR